MNAKYRPHLQGTVRFSLLSSGQANLREHDRARGEAHPRGGAA